jgi:P-type E1-E2 ATPase
MIVVMEVTKLISTFLIDHDADLKNENSYHQTKCFTYNIHEDLGLIKYVFTDKTGTLTTNKLKFKSIFIGNTQYKSISRSKLEEEEKPVFSINATPQKN